MEDVQSDSDLDDNNDNVHVENISKQLRTLENERKKGKNCINDIGLGPIPGR